MTHISVDLALFALGFVSWAISTASAGGGSLLFMAAIAPLLRGHALAPVITVASAIASPARAALFWGAIEWRLVRWYLPGATLGAILGGWFLAHLNAAIVQAGVGLFLLSTLWQYRLGNRARSFRMRLPWFMPVSFVSGTVSATLGASGLLSNPFYLNFGLTKERMLATRAVNSLTIQIVKLVSYQLFGVLNLDLLHHGASAGLGAALAVWLTRPWLLELDQQFFRKLTVAMMVIAGGLTLWQQRLWIIRLLGVS